MWDHFKVGKGNSGNSSSSYIGTRMWECIGENSVSYWLSNITELKLGGVIMKDTDEGRKLTKLLEEGRVNAVMAYCEKVAMENVSMTKLRSLIVRYGALRFNAGVHSTQAELRRCLGI
jgi:hypothetical protein